MLDTAIVALEPLFMSLKADGYTATIEPESAAITIRVVATEDACEECLCPQVVMQEIMEAALRDAGIDLEVQLVYPSDQ